jgi:hypothetical protein
MNLVSELGLPVSGPPQRAGPPQLSGVDGIYGIDKLPVIWPGSSGMSPNHGLAPDVS